MIDNRPQIIGTIRLLDVRYFIEDDGRGGSMPVYVDLDSQGIHVPRSDETIECETVEKAAQAILDHGCSQDAGSWYCDPDGTQTVDHGTGEQSECSAHPAGFTDDDLVRIGDLVAEMS